MNDLCHKMLGVMILLLVSSLAKPAAAQTSSNHRLARFASRDAEVFLHFQDRAAFLRRARQTDIYRSWTDMEGWLSDEDLEIFPAPRKEVLSPQLSFLADNATDILAHGRGEVALSIEGFSMQGGVPRPETLLLMDVSKSLNFFEALRELVAGEITAEEVNEMGLLPFPLSSKIPPSLVAHTVDDIFVGSTASGSPVAMAELDGVLVMADSDEAVGRTLARYRSPLHGSLSDHPGYVELFQAVGDRPGSVFWYVNLAQLRHDGIDRFLKARWLKGIMLLDHEEFDGMGFSLRAVGDQFEFRLALDLGRSPAGRAWDTRLARSDRPFSFLNEVDSQVVGCFAARLNPEGIPGAIALANRLNGGAFNAATLHKQILDVVEPETLEALASIMGEEYALFQLGVQSQQRLSGVFLLETTDPDRLSATLDNIALSSSRFSRTEVGGSVLYTLHLPRNGGLWVPAFSVSGRWLVGASNASCLRVFLSREERGDPLGESGAFLSPFDRLDQSPEEPMDALLYVNMRHLASLVFWVEMFNEKFVSGPGSIWSAVAALWNDPEVTDAMNGFLLMLKMKGNLVLIEGTGP